MRSRIVQSRFLVATVLLGLLLATLSILTPTNAFALSGPEQDYLNRINSLRTSLGLNALEVDATMTALAVQHTQEMIASNDLHHPPRLSAGAGDTWTKLGENVGFGTSLGITWDAFVKSPGHYANLVDPAFTRVGIAVINGPDGRQWTTHRFLATGSVATAPASAAPAATPAPTPTKTPAAQPVSTTPAPSSTPTPAPVAVPLPTPAPADPRRVAGVLDALQAA